jgi:hypothetical protein
MLLVYGNETALDEMGREDCYKESVQLCHDLTVTGQYLAAAPLHRTSLATSVRVREGKSVITDGPFAETHEQLGGYYMVEAANLDEALKIAERIPGARWGTVEVRPVVELDNMPEKIEAAAASAS